MVVLHDPDLNISTAGGSGSDQGPRQADCAGIHGNYSGCLELPRLMQHLKISTAVLLDPDPTMPIAGGGDSDQGPQQVRCDGRHRKLQQLPGAAKAYATPQSHI